MTQFDGFSTELVSFFSDLEKNNEKEWFAQNKAGYEHHVMNPAREFVTAMGERLRKIAPDINAIPKVNQSLFRINRDTRFSKDKRPYKTKMGIWFWEGGRKRMECPGFYFHLDGRKLMLGTGLYRFTKELLATYREAVIDKKSGPQLVRAIAGVSCKNYNIGSKHYKRIPRGYDPGHKNAEFLLYDGLHAAIELKIPREFYSGKIVDFAFRHYKNMLPIHQWLVDAL